MQWNALFWLSRADIQHLREDAPARQTLDVTLFTGRAWWCQGEARRASKYHFTFRAFGRLRLPIWSRAHFNGYPPNLISDRLWSSYDAVENVDKWSPEPQSKEMISYLSLATKLYLAAVAAWVVKLGSE